MRECELISDKIESHSFCEEAFRRKKHLFKFPKNLQQLFTFNSFTFIKSTVMQIEKALLVDCLRVLKVS